MKNGSIALVFPYHRVRDASRVIISPCLICCHSKRHKKAPTSQSAPRRTVRLNLWAFSVTTLRQAAFIATV